MLSQTVIIQLGEVWHLWSSHACRDWRPPECWLDSGENWLVSEKPNLGRQRGTYQLRLECSLHARPWAGGLSWWASWPPKLVSWNWATVWIGLSAHYVCAMSSSAGFLECGLAQARLVRQNSFSKDMWQHCEIIWTPFLAIVSLQRSWPCFLTYGNSSTERQEFDMQGIMSCLSQEDETLVEQV